MSMAHERDNATPAASSQPPTGNSTLSDGEQQQQQPNNKKSNKKLTVCIEGCAHGELDIIYGTIQHAERTQNFKCDLLICCGDFQAIRSSRDLRAMSVPQKHMALKDFYKYYNGEKTAPIPTLFIGGNHEASNHLWELYVHWLS